MSGVRFALFSAVLAPALGSCAFVLDFDSLQAGGGGQGGQLLSGGSSGIEAGAPGTSGSAGGGDEVCDGEVVGLVLDGVDETVLADTHHRVTATGGDDDFFLSVYSVAEGEPAVTLYRLGARTADFSEMGRLSGAARGDLGEPVSAAGLAFQPGAGLLHAYVALRTLTGSGARVWHAVMNGSTLEMLGLGALVSESYWEVSPYNYPVAATLGSVPAVAWLNADQSIGLEGGGLEENATLSNETRAMALGLLGTEADEPAVLYGAPEGMFIERPGEEPVSVAECQTAPGAYLSVATTATTIPGFWIGAWTKFAPETEEEEAFLTTEGLGVYCGGGASGCALQERDCEGVPTNNLVRNAVTSVVHRPGTSAGLVEVVQARPQLLPAEDGESVLARLVLTQDAVDFGIPPFANEPVTTSLGAEIELSAQETSEETEFRGPDWPVIAHVAPDRYLVAWIEPAAGGDALRVQRYRLCLP